MNNITTWHRTVNDTYVEPDASSSLAHCQYKQRKIHAVRGLNKAAIAREDKATTAVDILRLGFP